MEQQNSSIERKVKIGNHVYWEIFNFFKTGGHEIKAIREELSKVLNSTNPAILEIRHIRILANAINKTKKQLNDSKILFHSKGLRQTREYAYKLLTRARQNTAKQKEGCL